MGRKSTGTVRSLLQQLLDLPRREGRTATRSLATGGVWSVVRTSTFTRSVKVKVAAPRSRAAPATFPSGPTPPRGRSRCGAQDRAGSRDFLEGARNVVLVAQGALGKTMIAQNIARSAVLAGRSVLFLSAAQLLRVPAPRRTRSLSSRSRGPPRAARLVTFRPSG